MPYNQAWQMNKGDLKKDMLLTFIIFPCASVLAQLVLKWLKPLYFTEHLQIENFSLITNHFLFWNFLLVLLLTDFVYYWVHRAFHRFKMLWQLHAIHHSAERIYSINSGSFHFVEVFISSIIYFFPMYLIGVSADVIILVISMSLITGFLEHVNIDFKAGVLNYVFNTAELHRWHHSIVVHESNSNYGKIFSFWDIIFGTFLLPKDKNIELVGVDTSSTEVRD
jgi:sterol desaturase/sphingolipid hydroxylase (fatty acid hydroxylase superfamily)